MVYTCSYTLLIDGEEKKSGSILEDFDPAVNPPEEIDDPEDSKPEDWVDTPKYVINLWLLKLIHPSFPDDAGASPCSLAHSPSARKLWSSVFTRCNVCTG